MTTDRGTWCDAAWLLMANAKYQSDVWASVHHHPGKEQTILNDHRPRLRHETLSWGIKRFTVSSGDFLSSFSPIALQTIRLKVEAWRRRTNHRIQENAYVLPPWMDGGNLFMGS